MAEDSDTEDIVIEFEGNFDLDSVAGKQLQIVGMESDEPVLKIESKFYTIDFKHSIGSRLVLAQNSQGKLEYQSKTDKLITARRVMVKEKGT